MAFIVVRAWQIADTHQEFADDLAAHEFKFFFKEFDPIVFCLGVVVINPFCK